MTVRESAGQVEVLFDDNGRGFDAVARAQAFVPFFTRKLNGLGLGLTYVQKVVRAHGGTASIGTAEAGGARVRVLLPAAGASPAAARAPATGAATPAAERGA